MRLILLTVLIGGGAIILLQTDVVLGLIALSFVPIVGVRASIARMKLRDAWMRLQDELSICLGDGSLHGPQSPLQRGRRP